MSYKEKHKQIKIKKQKNKESVKLIQLCRWNRIKKKYKCVVSLTEYPISPFPFPLSFCRSNERRWRKTSTGLPLARWPPIIFLGVCDFPLVSKKLLLSLFPSVHSSFPFFAFSSDLTSWIASLSDWFVLILLFLW